MIQSQDIINTKISLISFDNLLQNVCKRTRGYICFANVHMCVEVYQNPAFRLVVNNATYTVADGVPIQKSLKLLFDIDQERIAGMDFMPALIGKASIENVPVFFYGSDCDTLKKIKERALKENPRLQINGMFSPPFRRLTQEEQKDIILQINLSGASIVFVCLGCPKQEIWMAENSSKINAVLLGVGGAFETYAEIKKRAPKIIRQYGMEWMFRFIQDPKRLWKRYLYTNSLFLYLIVKDFLKIKFNKFKLIGFF